jgi:hypothetical protein
MTDGTNGKEAPRRSDDDFITLFESGELPNSEFRHGAHVRLTWLYLQRHSLPTTLDLIWKGIQQFAASKGQSKLFHQTITIFFTLLIYQRIRAASSTATWETFSEANPDLFRFRECILRYYDQETLNSDVARHSFVFPNRARE